MMRKIILTVLLSAICIVPSMAQSATFTLIPYDTHSTSMANSSVALYATPFALWNNGASTLFSEESFQAGASYGIWQPSQLDNRILTAAGYYRIGEKVAISAGYRNISYSPYDIVDDNGNIKTKFTPSEMEISAGLSYKLLPAMGLYANVNYISSVLGSNNSATSVGADAGIYVDLKALKLGLAIVNIGGELNYGGENAYPLPTMAKIGVSTTQIFDKNAISGSIEGDYIISASSLALSLGVEYKWNKMVRINCGYHYGDKENIPSYLSFGGGLDIVGIKLGATYIIGTSNDSPINGSIMCTLAYAF